jgi:hypothetical protein
VAFKKFIDEQVSNGGAELKLDEALARWDCENQTPEERQQARKATRERSEEMDTSKSQPVHDVVEELRKKHVPTSSARTLQSNPEEWVKRLHELVHSQPIRPCTMDDSRESIYAGRGE